MTLHEIKQTGFGKWLLLQSEREAELHLWECLSSGPADNLGWSLFQTVHGDDWTANGETLRPMLQKAITALREA